MNVAVVTPRYPLLSTGGGEKSAQLLATTLAESDRIDGVTVFSFDGTGTTTRDGVTIRRLGAVSSTVTEYQNLRATLKLRSHLSSFDVVHGYNMELHPTVGYVASRADVASVATLNSYHFFPSSVANTTPTAVQRVYELIGQPTTGRLLRHFMRRIDVFVALSEAIQAIYENNGFASARFHHIPNMIDPEFEVPDHNTADEDGYALLYVGSLSENKGVSHLIRALSSLPDDYRLRIVGDGPRADRLHTLARTHGVADRTEFSGWVPYEEISAVYAEADLFVHPGIWPEPLNRTVLEAMQAGLPVVCTEIGGPPEVIPDSDLLCEPADPPALAAAISRARTADRDIGATNREYVLANHMPATIIDQIIDLYETVAQAGPNR